MRSAILENMMWAQIIKEAQTNQFCLNITMRQQCLEEKHCVGQSMFSGQVIPNTKSATNSRQGEVLAGTQTLTIKNILELQM